MSTVNTPASGSKSKGVGDLKSRLLKLQESPSFAVSAAPSGTPPPVGHYEWAIHSARTPSSGRPPLPDTRASAPALISPVSLYSEVNLADDSLIGSAMKSSRPSAALSFDHLAPTPGPSQQGN